MGDTITKPKLKIFFFQLQTRFVSTIHSFSLMLSSTAVFVRVLLSYLSPSTELRVVFPFFYFFFTGEDLQLSESGSDSD